MMLVSVWLTSLSMIISESIRVAANAIILFLFCGWVIFLCVYVRLLHLLLCWWRFRLLPCLGDYIVVLQWTLGYMYLFQSWFSLDRCPGVRLLVHTVILFLVFCGTSILFTIMVAPIYIPTNSVRGFPFLHTSPAFIDFLMMGILAGVR